MRSCRSICRRTRCSAAPAWSRPAPMSRSCCGTIAGGLIGRYRWPPPAVLLVALDRPDRRAARCRPRRPRPTRRRQDGLAHHPRLDPPGQRDPAHPAPVPRHRLDQLLLDDGRDPRHPVPAAGEERASTPTSRSRRLFLAIFSVGVAIGSVLINRLLKGQVSARYSPAAAIAMGLFICHLYWNVRGWPAPGRPS